MKLGLGLYRHMLDKEHFQFARQCGCTHLVVHYVDYFNKGDGNHRSNQPIGGRGGWGYAGDPEKLWSLEELRELKERVEAEGLVLEAIENFDPAHWHDILLDGPKKKKQLEGLKTIIRRVGQAGIPVFGYNFSLAGVAGRVQGPYARGNAHSVAMDGNVDQTPIPNGMIWNMVFDPKAPEGNLPPITHEELWRRLGEFLEALVPVAQEAGVTLAAHPDDPPVPVLRGQPRLVYQPWMYQRLLDIVPSAHNALEFCLGSLAEMTEGNIYEAVDLYSRQKKVAYIHFRNVKGKVPEYRETFVDDGEIDMVRVLKILKKNQFTGVLIPDHTPLMSAPGPWHAGMAYTLGYMNAAMKTCL